MPNKFRFAGQIFTKKGDYIEDTDGDSIFDSLCTDFSNLGEEVEVIEEEPKIPDKLEIIENGKNNYCLRNEIGTFCSMNQHTRLIANKLNEVIDYLDYLKAKDSK